MRALVYTDLQATTGHENLYNDPSKSLQIWRVDRFYDQLHSIYEEYECDCLWDLGDTTDDHSAIPIPAIDSVCAGLRKFPVSENSIKLIGNHEHYRRDGNTHPGAMYTPCFGHVVDHFTVIKNVYGIDIHAYAYPADYALLENKIVYNLSHATRPVLLLGHFGVVGASLNAATSNRGVDPKHLKDTVCLLGHIHKPHTVSGTNAHYVGSPFQQNWGESGEDKRVAVVEIEKGTIGIEWIPITGYPKYQEITYTELKDLDYSSEDRLSITLDSPEEASAFYAHKAAERIKRVNYNFQKEESSGEVASADPATALRDYVEDEPPETHGISVDDDFVLEEGMALLN